MPAWILESLSNNETLPGTVMAWRIASALLLGGVVAGVYRWARRGLGPPQATFLTTLVLLSVTIAMATQVIGDSVARAFSLVGALSVARFRTVVKDTQDTAFVILAVVVGMAAGANDLLVALVGLGVVGIASPVLWPRRRDPAWTGAEVDLKLRLAAAQDVREAIERILADVSTRATLVSIETARQGASIDLAYRVRLRRDRSPVQTAAELNQTPGVEAVELRRADRSFD
ncbi:DUF4956 domain-containing protein [Planctomyces sp. SH-PL62]|uniref:DUF4956 domain-containing protein n=1 Tax=Planctomyces sp. SH-PL62 TaxID=1636152 RepID=UPI00078C0AD9|nr:DUF4956 domain-containing protein [Planctomyces sp. SH-PL62]AMV37956.1 hypothetical protein VT85_11005 [Planctomyces sp. SH-PL62]